ncbi:hypothetical protein EKN24_06845 [Enterobacter asburiae]|uniref:hypothetical protein n=1 Tax=Enterobacter TaxID=547 RepID=UPI000F897FAB|nr:MULTISPECIES: hypothetical protein [Enterobacter]HCR0386695.1 hypothetical protein [Enterobacter kobei]MCK6732295.1 hypothetical protein [Enterobacter bugandensis]MCK7424233.1 hypothetical protein [Enterobacter bugandensis]QIB82840.1 hypothetical protein G0034_14510 [Enterobacter sp. T2]RUN97859.1 hypothetical protein EKN24_06845 [Enterobacter asburiae]
MTIEFESSPEGARQGIAEHERKIKELLAEETAICDDALDGNYNQERLDEIHKEIAYRKSQIEKLKGYLKP